MTGYSRGILARSVLDPYEQDVGRQADSLTSDDQVKLPSIADDEIAADGQGGTGSSTTVTASGDTLIDALLKGTKWALGTITYTDPDNANDYQAGYVVDNDKDTTSAQNEGFSQISAGQLLAVQYALDEVGGSGFSVAGFTNLGIDYGGSGVGTGTIRVANTSDNDTGLTFYPADDVYAGDAWMGTDIQSPVQGNYAWNNTLHELGHGLGLKHAHEAKYGNPALDSGHDTLEYTVMTYRSYENGGTGYSNGTWDYPQTYMMLDIQALQYLYGADFTSNSGDTTYTWDQDTGQGKINGVLSTNPGNGIGGAANRIFMTIWDGGGIDTYDLGNYTSAMKLDLRPGEWSTFDTAQLADLDAGHPGTHMARGNVANALLYQGDTSSLIENAIGGSGADEIIGNVLDNSLNGGNNDDTLYGDIGNDVLDGGGGDFGNDKLIGGFGTDTFYGQLGDDKIYGDYEDVYDQGDADVINAGGGKDSIQGGGGDDLIYGDTGTDEHYVLGDDSDFIHGGTGNDTAYGGGSDDTVYGGDGNDSLYGGDHNDIVYGEKDNDFLDGGFGTDSLYGGAGMDRIYGGAVDDDYIEGGDDSDTVDAGRGNDIVFGDNVTDVFTGTYDNLKGGGGSDTVHGGGGADSIYGDFDTFDAPGGDPDKDTDQSGADVLFGDGGMDNIYGGGGDDVIDGGDETGSGDFLAGGDGNDSITGGAGNDSIFGGKGIDTLVGGIGDDAFYVDDKKDVITEKADEGTDYAYSTSYNYTLSDNVEYLTLIENTDATRGFGGKTDNFIFGNKADNLLDGGDGNDCLVGGAGNDVLKGGDGHDLLVGGTDNDSFYIDAGDVDKHGYASISEMAGEGTADVVYTTASFALSNDEHADEQEVEMIFLQTGAKNVSGNLYANRIVGNGSANKLSGMDGNDTLAGGKGNDNLLGGNDQDFLYGEDDNDVLNGGKQKDELTGGLGRDKLIGGADGDTFVFDSVKDSGMDKDSADLIQDFTKGDKIDLSGLTGKLGWVGKHDFSGHGGGVGYDKADGGVLVRVDGDGDGDLDMTIFCDNITKIAKTDFDL